LPSIARAVLAFLLAVCCGCHPGWYRQQADDDAARLIQEKASDPRWALPQYGIQIDSRSRMFDPTNPDCPPMPPDDPGSHGFMHEVDGKRGWPHWHRNGDTPFVENPDWLQCLPLNEEGVLVLDATTAIRLALLHSRDYQSQLEELYLSALDVSFERFRFDSQFFAGYTLDYSAAGRLQNEKSGSQSVLTAATFPDKRGVRMERLFTTGAELVVGLANSLVWQFSGPDTYAASTILDFSLVQPLLRGAGREVVLERLTLAERTLLANVRQMERYRHGFYLRIMTGVDAGAGPSRRGGVFGGAGLEGFTGVGGGGFGRLAGGAVVTSGGTGAAQVGGFMGLLQTQQEIRNQEDNLAALRSNYLRLFVTLQELLTTIPESSETIVRQRLQVAQARQAVLNAESRLINSRNAYQRQLDNFKITLGLPPQICVKIQDPMLDRVNLIDPQIRPIQSRVSELQQKVGDVILDILPEQGAAEIRWNAELAANLARLKQHLNEVQEIRRLLMEGDDAQIRRVRDDGLKLGRELARVLQAEIQRRTSGRAEPADNAEVAGLRADAALLDRVQKKIESGDEWLQRLQGFNLLRDTIDDIDRLKQELAAPGVLNVEWMRSDPNPATRDLYQQYRDRLNTLAGTPAAQRAPLIQPLVRQLDQVAQPLVQQRQRILQDNPWLGELDRWRIAPDDAEAALNGGEFVEVRRLKRLFVQFVDTLLDAPAKFDTLPAKVKAYEAKIDALLAEGPRLTPDELIRRFRQDISPAIPQDLVDLANNVLELSLVQARDRAETVSLAQVDLHPDAALEIARQNRLDWMNARAALVDSWRLIQFNADDLQSTLDIVFSGDLGTRDDNPFKFDAANGRLRAALQFDAPLTRLSERNTYRQALIEYQQARRNYYAYQDQVASGLRDTIRTIQSSQRNFEIRRDAVRVADLQIELNEDIRRLQEANRQPSGPTAARDAVSALSDLLSAQNDFLSVWVTYEVLRRALDFNLGTMQLDSDGLWIDPGPIGPDHGYPGLGADSECWPGPMVMPRCQPTEAQNAPQENSLESLPPTAGHPE
jgi:hypothetical protein